MAKKNHAAVLSAAFKSVSYLAIFAMAVVFNMSLVSCTEDEYDREEDIATKSMFEPSAPVIPGLEFNFIYELNNRGWRVETPWTVTEKVTELNERGTSSDWVSHKNDRYAVIDALRNVSLQYTQEHTSAAQLFTKTVLSSADRKEYRDSVRYSAMIEDGNIAYLDCVNERLEVSVRDTLREMPYIRTKSAKVKAINTLPGTTQYQTRATYVSDSICREVVWDLEKEVVGKGIAESKIFNVELRDTFKVLLLSEDNIDRAYAKDKNRVVIDDLTERCSFTEVFVMKSGETHENPKSIILNRELKGIAEYLKTVTSFNYTWRRDNGVKLGSVINGVRTDGNWVVDSRTDSFGAEISNDSEPLTTAYTFYHEGTTYQDEWVKVNFELITPTMAEKNSRVESIVSDDDNYDMARLFNTINTTYLGYAQSAGETVKLQKPAVRVRWEGWESLEGTRVIYNDSIQWIPVYRIEYTNGDVIRTPFLCSDDRGLVVLSAWESIEANANQSTGSIVVEDVTTRDMNRTVNGAVFTWKRATRMLHNVATLNASRQDNQWRSVEPIEMTVTYRNNSVTYTDPAISTDNTATVSGGDVVAGYHVYNYADDLAYRFGDNVKHVAAPGTIKVLAEGIVSEDWDEASAREVWTNDSVLRSVDWVVKYNTGRETRTKFAHNEPRSFSVNPGWESIEKNANYRTGNPVVSVTSSTTLEHNVNGATFSCLRETRSIKSAVTLNGSTQTNSWTASDPTGCKVTYNGKPFDFGQKTVSVSHRDNLTGGNESNGYKVYNYGDALSYTVGGNTKSLTAPGTIKVQVEGVVSEGWDESSAREVWSDSNVSWTLDWVVKYNTGREERTPFTYTETRIFRVETNWSSIEKNTNYSTSNPAVSVASTTPASKVVNGATFSWTRETRSIKNSVTLAGSTQTNGWTAIDPMGCKVTYKNKTYDFGRKNVSVSHRDNLTSGNERYGYMVYGYSDALSYTVGNNTKSLTAPGLVNIKIADPTFFPEEWGELVDAKQTVANNESHNSYVYTWSLRFKKGYVLPVVIRPGSSQPEWHFEYVEKTNDTTYNGGTYQSSTRTWVNTTAEDQPNQMTWNREGTMRANKSYSTAEGCGWDEGHKVQNHASVNTSRYQFTITDGKLTARDTYTGVSMGSWTSYTGD